MCFSKSYFKTYFANFLADFDEESYQTHKERKEKLFHDVRGKVLEIGPGTGVNYEFLNSLSVEWFGIEPNEAMHPFLNRKARNNGFKPVYLSGTSEVIGAEDARFDFVISTEVLCSVENVDQTLSEILRVLKPGGQFLFLEHVVDQRNPWRKFLQKGVIYTPWIWYADGCHPARDLVGDIENAGFSETSIEEYMQEGKGVIQMINRPHIVGRATK